MAAECNAHRLVADVTLLVAGKVLLVRYADASAYDGQRGWFVPDDLLRHEEHPEAAAKRILKDQLGCDRLPMRLDHVESFGGSRWHLVFHFRSEPGLPPTVVPGKNVAVAEWFSLDGLPPMEDTAHEGWTLDIVRRVATRAPPP